MHGSEIGFSFRSSEDETLLEFTSPVGREYMHRRRSFIESKTTVVQTSNVSFTSEVSDYLVVHTGPAEFKPYYGALLPENLGAYCLEWLARKVNAKVQINACRSQLQAI